MFDFFFFFFFMENPFTVNYAKKQHPNPQNLGGGRETWENKAVSKSYILNVIPMLVEVCKGLGIHFAFKTIITYSWIPLQITDTEGSL